MEKSTLKLKPDFIGKAWGFSCDYTGFSSSI